MISNGRSDVFVSIDVMTFEPPTVTPLKSSVGLPTAKVGVTPVPVRAAVIETCVGPNSWSRAARRRDVSILLDVYIEPHGLVDRPHSRGREAQRDHARLVRRDRRPGVHEAAEEPRLLDPALACAALRIDEDTGAVSGDRIDRHRHGGGVLHGDVLELRECLDRDLTEGDGLRCRDPWSEARLLP